MEKVISPAMARSAEVRDSVLRTGVRHVAYRATPLPPFVLEATRHRSNYKSQSIVSETG